ncbi:MULTISPECIES: hypothetical protein [Niastella]|uniref:Adhesin domain-containing protein n=1 Tax=Niastella soli TaxID=2821487 RepID=A0ABS3Z1G9_9BACT|nr:hypothetical protein [Niastella soli]MBO9203515.1 hypothetical protein [Niastella soli]
MMKNLIIVFISALSLMTAQAQEYKLGKSGGKMIINLSNVVIEGYNGNEIIFSSLKPKSSKVVDPREEGLQAINEFGNRDNTGLGISVLDKGSVVEVNQVVPDSGIKILVPKGLILSFVNRKITQTEKIICRNVENEIEIDVEYNPVQLENVTGPVVVRSLYGAVEAIFNRQVKGPISIAAVFATVDVAIPVDTKANLKLKSEHSYIMTSPDFKIEVEKSKDDSVYFYGNLVTGKLNGGGQDFKVSSEYGKVYLRKTK